MNRNTVIGIIVVIAILLLIIFWNPLSNALNLNQNQNGEDSAEVDSIQLAMLDYEGVGEESTGPVRGCDRLVFLAMNISPTTMPLTAAMEELFAIGGENIEGWNNFIAQTNDTLSFDRAEVRDGTAHIYLEGELSGLRGVCDNPRAAIQITETALRFPTVDNVQLYLNGEPTDLIPSEQGTATTTSNN